VGDYTVAIISPFLYCRFSRYGRPTFASILRINRYSAIGTGFQPAGRGRGEKGEGLRAYGIGLVRGHEIVFTVIGLRYRPRPIAAPYTKLTVIRWDACAGLVARVSSST